MNEDVEYETLTKELYQGLINAQGIKTIQVQHNVKIKGKAAEHQIDVFWEFELAGVRNKVAIECKNYNRPISKTVVTSFYSVLCDIGNINGIIVTTKGFQKGAKEFALHYGISLKELREPTNDDWKGRLKSIYTQIIFISINITKIHIQVDEDWVKENIKSTYNDGFKYKATGSNDKMWIRDNSGSEIKSLLELENDLRKINQISDPTENINFVFDLENSFYDFLEFGLIKIKSVRYTYDVITSKTELTIDSSATTRAILKDVFTGELIFFKKKWGYKLANYTTV